MFTMSKCELNEDQEIFERSGLRASFWNFLSLISSNLLLIPLGIVSSVLTARILGKEGYGYIAMFNLVTQFVIMITANWTAISVVRLGREEYDRSGKVNFTFWARNTILLPCLVVGAIVIYFLRSLIAHYMEMPNWIIFFVIAFVILAVLRGYLDLILQAIQRIKLYAILQIFSGAISITGLLLIFLDFFPKNYISVIVIILVTSGLTLLIPWIFFVPRSIFLPIKINRGKVQEVFTFSYPIIIGNLTAYFVNWMDVMVIKYYFTLSEVGGYQLAYNIFNHIVGSIGSVTLLMTPILTSFLTFKREDLMIRYSTRIAPQGILIWATLMGLGIGISPLIFRIFFGEEFRISGVYFQFLGLGLAFNMIIAFYSSEITAYKLIKWEMIANVARGIVNLIGDLLLIPRVGPLGASIATTLGIIVSAFLYLLICQRQLKLGLFWQLTLVLPSLVSLGISHFVSSWTVPFWASGMALITGYYLMRRFRIFKVEDINLLDQVRIPILVKRVIYWGYPFLAR